MSFWGISMWSLHRNMQAPGDCQKWESCLFSESQLEFSSVYLMGELPLVVSNFQQNMQARNFSFSFQTLLLCSYPDSCIIHKNTWMKTLPEVEHNYTVKKSRAKLDCTVINDCFSQIFGVFCTEHWSITPEHILEKEVSHSLLSLLFDMFTPPTELKMNTGLFAEKSATS